jgi:DNA repair exonuclease SbcCD nuclease subunit
LNGNRPDTEIRILHTSDNHIDGLSTCAALGKVVDKANELKVDLVLLAGDFFDNSRVEDKVVWETIAQLRRLEMQVVLVPGNHDQLDSVSVYHNAGFMDLPNNVHLIRRQEGETVLFPDLKVSVWGRPTYDHEMNFRPLQGSPPRNGPWWHIGVAHGWYVPPGEICDRSSPIFSYDIEATGYDYVALGHSDLFSDLSQATVRAAYSGAPILNSSGTELGSVALINLHPELGVHIQQVPVTD